MRAILAASAPERGGLLLIVAAGVLWGTVGVSTRTLFTIADTTALSVAFCRLALSLPALGIASAGLLGRSRPRVKPAHVLAMAVIGVMLALYQVCFFGAIQRVGVAVSTLVTLCSAPVMVAVLSAVLLRERLGARPILALVAALAGTMLLASPDGSAEAGTDTLTGVLLALGSGFGYATMAVLSRSIARHYHPLLPVTVGFAVGSLVLLPAMLADGPQLSFSPFGWLILLYLGLVPTALGYVLFTRGI